MRCGGRILAGVFISRNYGHPVSRFEFGQCLADCALDEVVRHTLVSESYFLLGGVHVDIHKLGIQLKKQRVNRLSALVEHISVGLSDRM